jgi:hypothetical protein
MGFLWTVHAVGCNTMGGQQPRQYNAALLASLGYDFYRKGKPEDAYAVLKRSLALRPNPDVRAMLISLHVSVKAPVQRFWAKSLFSWKAHPAVYNAPIVTLALAGVVALLLTIGSQSTMMIKSKWPASTTNKGARILIYRGTEGETVNTP